MIFRQHQQVIDGTKTQTRRLWKPNYALSFSDGAVQAIYNTLTSCPLFELGQRLPVIPKRTQPAIRLNGEMARVRVTSLRKERLQDISSHRDGQADARAEGVESVGAYQALWQSINGKTKGARWGDNPFVLVITFERTKELLDAVKATRAGG